MNSTPMSSTLEMATDEALDRALDCAPGPCDDQIEAVAADEALDRGDDAFGPCVTEMGSFT